MKNDSNLETHNHNISVIAVDLDGTLLRSDGTVSPRTLQVLQRCSEASYRIVIATGRRPASVATVLPPELPAEAWVCYNGCQVQVDGLVIHEELLHPQDSRRIAEWVGARWPQLTIYAEVDGQVFVSKDPGMGFPYQVADISQIVSRRVVAMWLGLASVGDAELLQANLPPGCRVVVTGQGEWAAIMPRSASKAAGLELLLRTWGLSLYNAIAFGDEMNDLELVAESGIGVAMGNAVPEIKQVADRVTLTNDEDGVAVVLEELLRGGLGWSPFSRA